MPKGQASYPTSSCSFTRRASPHLQRMREKHERADESRRSSPEDFLYPIHPERGGSSTGVATKAETSISFCPVIRILISGRSSPLLTSPAASPSTAPSPTSFCGSPRTPEFMDEDGSIGPAVPSFESI
jgi:hypothetical protein